MYRCVKKDKVMCVSTTHTTIWQNSSHCLNGWLKTSAEIYITEITITVQCANMAWQFLQDWTFGSYNNNFRMLAQKRSLFKVDCAWMAPACLWSCFVFLVNRPESYSSVTSLSVLVRAFLIGCCFHSFRCSYCFIDWLVDYCWCIYCCLNYYRTTSELLCVELHSVVGFLFGGVRPANWFQYFEVIMWLTKENSFGSCFEWRQWQLQRLHAPR